MVLRFYGLELPTVIAKISFRLGGIIFGQLTKLVKLANFQKVPEFEESGDAQALSMGANPGTHSSLIIRRLQAGSKERRSHPMGGLV